MLLRLLITLFFLLSGATALVYQVVWVRMLGLLVGHSVLAISAVVATYMAGLGLGARFAGRRANDLRRPLVGYGAMEVGIGLFALLSPLLLRLADGIVGSFGSGSAATLGTLAVASGVLLLPTMAMGATLPLITRWYARDAASLGRDMGWLYAINTTGAVVGAGLAGFVLLPSLGQPTTLGLAVAVNVLVGGLAIAAGWRHPLAPHRLSAAAVSSDAGAEPTGGTPAVTALTPAIRRAILLAFAISGAAALSNQVTWNRSFVLFTGSTTYAFSLIVCAFIAGLALGGHVFARIVDRSPDRVRLLAALNVAIAAAAAVLIPLLGELPLLLVEPLAALSGSFAKSQGLVFGVLFLLVVVPTFLMGGTYPVATRALATNADDAPETVGRAYAWNTAGAIVGALVGGLVLLPMLGIRNTLWLAVGLNLVAAAVLLGSRRRLVLALPLLALVGSLGSPAWNPRHMNLAPHMYATDLASDPVYMLEMRDSGSLLFHEEGIGATVSVLQRSSGTRVMRIDGKTDASSQQDQGYQGMAGTLPLLLSERRDRLFMLGLGSGMSLAASLEQPLQQVTLAELLPEVVRGARHFDELLGAPLTDPRVELKIGDGRHLLLRTEQRYDAVTSNPTNLFIAGMSTLFTVEAFEDMRRALEPGGVAVVWLQGYLLLQEDFATVLRSFQHVFPEAHLWSGDSFDYFLVGHLAPMELRADELEARIAGLAGSRTARWTGLSTAADLQRHYLAGPDSLRRIAGAGPLQRQADPFLEFSAPRGLYEPAGLVDCAALLARRERIPLDLDPALLDARLEAARAVDAASFEVDIDALQAALEADPDHPVGRAQLARLLHGLALAEAAAGELASAEQRLGLLLSLEPEALVSWRLLAAVQRAGGRDADAVATLRAARDGQPWNVYAHLALALQLEELGRSEEAAVSWAEVLRLDPDLPELR
jgi:spermidine synthase